MVHRPAFKLSHLVCVTAVWLAACGGGAPTPTLPARWSTEGWQTSPPEAQGIDSERLSELFGYIEDENLNVQSVIVIRNGTIVLEAYFPPSDPDVKFALRSCTKSITATLIGIAIDKGYIEGIGQPVLDFFPDREVANLDSRKQDMTLEDLLTMTSGFDLPPAEIPQNPDWVQVMLDVPMGYEPGTRFEYHPMVSHLLSAIITATTGKDALSFAQQNLFDPLGITDVVWSSDPMGINHGFSGLYLRPRDMAKIGYLYLNEGIWDGQEIVSPEWVEAATTVHFPAGEYYDQWWGGTTEWWINAIDGYGYQWWHYPSGMFAAEGYGGQRIFILPDLDMVTVLTGGYDQADLMTPYLLVEDFIRPAVVSPDPLPENPEGVTQLEAQIRRLTGFAPESVPPMPEITQALSGQTYILEDNFLNWGAFTLQFMEDEALLEVSVAGDSLELVIGLDGDFRITPDVESFAPILVDPLPVASRGYWMDASNFVFDLHVVGNPEHYTFHLTFGDDRVHIDVQDWVLRHDQRFTGWLQR